MIRNARWQEVKAFRSIGRKEWWHQRKDDGPDALSWDEIYARASESLEGTAAAGHARTIRKSYEDMNHDLRNRHTGQYFMIKDRRYRKPVRPRKSPGRAR
jgi:hypothetical protein